MPPCASPSDPFGHDPALIAYIAVLREALQGLVDGVTALQARHPALHPLTYRSLAGRVETAEEVLRIETGRHAEQELRIMEELTVAGYTLADFVFRQLYGVPRVPRGLIPTQAEIVEALKDMERLTQQSWALAALLCNKKSSIGNDLTSHS